MTARLDGPGGIDVGGLARTVVTNATREYPYALVVVLQGPADLALPRDRHPAFYGCFDWHSAVHTHWLLVRLLEAHADQLDADAVLAVLDAHLTSANLATEAAVLRADPTFERPYGWAWLTALAAVCRTVAPRLAPARRWAEALAPAADVVVGLVLDWLARDDRPVRDGTHASTAFALGLLLDAAGPLGRDDLVAAIEAYVRTWFLPDHDAPLHWEPSGHDFLSPGLAEADLVRRVLEPAGLASWLEGFWPGLAVAEPAEVLEPVEVHDRSDGHVGHLDGLNLSRAAALDGLGAVLPADDVRRRVLHEAAARHRSAGLAALSTGEYQSTHWLGTFAVLALDAASAAAGPSDGGGRPGEGAGRAAG